MRSVSIAPAIVALGLAAAFAMAVLDHESGLLTWIELSEERGTLREQIADQRRANEALGRQIEALQKDPFEAVRAIRAMDLAKSGETIVRFNSRNSPLQAEPSQASQRSYQSSQSNESGRAEREQD